MAETATQENTQTQDEQKQARPRNPIAASAYEVAGEAGNKLGSRVTSRQVEAVTAALGDRKPGEVISGTMKSLLAYAQTGDRDSLEGKSFGELSAFVKEAQGQDVLENDSQRRRLWPRKVAAILVAVSRA